MISGLRIAVSLHPSLCLFCNPQINSEFIFASVITMIHLHPDASTSTELCQFLCQCSIGSNIWNGDHWTDLIWINVSEGNYKSWLVSKLTDAGLEAAYSDCVQHGATQCGVEETYGWHHSRFVQFFLYNLCHQHKPEQCSHHRWALQKGQGSYSGSSNLISTDIFIWNRMLYFSLI